MSLAARCTSTAAASTGSRAWACRAFGEHATDRRCRRCDVAFGKSQQGEPGGRIPAQLAGGPIRRQRVGELAAEAVQFALLVASHTERRVERLGEARGRVLGLDGRRRPVAVDLEQLGTVHEALPAVRHEVGLRRAPVVEGLGPFGGAAQLEDVDTRLDHRAVDDAGRDRRDLARRHRHHRLVHRAQPGGELAARQRRLPAAEQPERQHVAIPARVGDGDDPCGELAGSRPASSDSSAARNDGTSSSPVTAHVGPAPSTRRSARASQPLPRAASPCSSRIIPSQNPHRAARSRVADVEVGEVGPLPRLHADRGLADQEGRNRQPLLVVHVERRRLREHVERSAPRATFERLAPSLQLRRHRTQSRPAATRRPRLVADADAIGPEHHHSSMKISTTLGFDGDPVRYARKARDLRGRRRRPRLVGRDLRVRPRVVARLPRRPDHDPRADDRDPADLLAHAGPHRPDRGDHRRAVGRAVPPRARQLGAPGHRGLARRPVRSTVAAHARDHRDLPSGVEPRTR